MYVLFWYGANNIVEINYQVMEAQLSLPKENPLVR